MEVVKTNTALKKTILNLGTGSIGFVPTMGALHMGHMSLLEKAIAENENTICSVFVNPAQFNDPEDFKKYPLTIEDDMLKLKKAGCDIVYLPGVEDVFPEGLSENKIYELGGLDFKAEGEYRPGHFQGVALVVDRLLEYVGPCKLYLGQKDIQQFQVIKYMIENTLHNVEAVMCPTIREPNGLAMSSRNKHLGSAEKAQLGIIYDTLCWAEKNIFHKPVKDIINDAKEKLIECTYINDVEYFEILTLDDFEPVIEVSKSGPVVVCVAVNTNKARLIDNILLFY
jgi:pantoate--beta-alanine ligase